MKTPKKSFATPSSKPNDVHYRLKRTRETLEAAVTFLSSIDPAVFGHGGRVHAEARDQILAALNTANGLVAPAKKARASAEDKAAAAAEKAKAKAKAAAHREAEKAVAAAEKAAAKAKPAKVVKTKSVASVIEDAPAPAGNSAIERALAAARARKAAQVSV